MRSLLIHCICLLCFTSQSIYSNAQSFAWAAAMGSPLAPFTPNDRGTAIKTDAAGNVYTTGAFTGTADFNPGAGVFNMTANNGNSFADMFIQKIDSNGNFLWAKQIVGDSFSTGYGLHIDAAGYIYITGFFRGTKDFDPGPGTYTVTSALADIFVLKLDSNGNFIWAKAMGGAGNEGGFGLDMDANGNLYVIGRFESVADFDPGPAVLNISSAGNFDIFIVKLTPAGNLSWARTMGGTGFDYGNSITYTAGSISFTGQFTATADFDPGPNTMNLTAAGTDVYVEKLDTSGNFVWVKHFQGNLASQSNGITSDASGNIYFTGSFWGIVDFDPGPNTNSQISVLNTYDIFISKLKASGDLLWVKTIGTSGDQRGQAITVDASSNVYAVGEFNGTMDFDPGTGSYVLGSANQDYYIEKLDNAGNFIWALAYGGSSNESALAIAVSSTNSIHTTGYFRATVDFDHSVNIFNLSSTGNDDIFIQKLLQSSCALPPQPGAISGSASVCTGTSQTYAVFPLPGISAYTWNIPAGWTGSSTTNSITVTPGSSSGTISVAAQNSCGNGPAQNLSVIATSLPLQPSPITGNTSACAGSIQTYTVNPVSNASYYLWTLPTGWMGSSSTNSISPTVASASGNVTVIAGNICGTSAPQVLSVNISTAPAATINAGGPTAFCSGGSVILTAGNAPSYQWYINATAINGATSSTYTASQAGNYTVVVSNGTCSSTSPAINVVVNAATAITTQPTSQSTCAGSTANFTVTASGAAPLSYQWRKNGTIISGATASTFSINNATWADAGNYDVVVTGSCGTVTSGSVSLTVGCTALVPLGGTEGTIELIPTIISDHALLRSDVPVATHISWTIFDITGRSIKRFEQQLPPGRRTEQVNLQLLPAGMYLLNGKTGKGRMIVIRFQKQ